MCLGRQKELGLDELKMGLGNTAEWSQQRELWRRCPVRTLARRGSPGVVLDTSLLPASLGDWGSISAYGDGSPAGGLRHATRALRGDFHVFKMKLEHVPLDFDFVFRVK